MVCLSDPFSFKCDGFGRFNCFKKIKLKIKNKLLQEGYRTFLFKNIRSVIVYNYENPNDLIGSKTERKEESQRKEAELKKLEQKQKNDGEVVPDIILEKTAEEKANF